MTVALNESSYDDIGRHRRTGDVLRREQDQLQATVSGNGISEWSFYSVKRRYARSEKARIRASSCK